MQSCGQAGGICLRILRMSHAALLLVPVFVQVALTFALLFCLGPARVGAMRRGEVKMRDIELGQGACPDRFHQIANSYANQFELPVLFYGLVLLALQTRKVDLWLLGGAWIFAASRLVHAYIYVTSNHVPRRFQAFA